MSAFTLDTLNRLKIAEPVRRKNLTIFPLVADDEPGPAYLTLDDAYRSKLVTITEVSDRGRVPELKVRNDADIPLLLLDGEELIGAKQNRVLNLSILVPAKSDLTVPVSCVEQGRWNYARSDFVSSDRAIFAAARARSSEHVTTNLRESLSRASNQSDVWNSIDAKLNKLKAHSPTRAMSASYEQAKTALDELAQPLPNIANQRGAIFAIDGRIVGVELFDRAETCAKLIAKVIRSYGLDAVESNGAETASRDEADRFVRQLAASVVERYDAIGLGSDWRLQSSEMSGGALVAGEACVHFAAFTRATRH